MILLVDNYDSFTYNLAHLFQELGAEVRVKRNDEDLSEESPSRLVISPGPGRPEEAGCSLELIRRLAPTTPVLGVCLGHQAIVEAYGGKVELTNLVHGKASPVEHAGDPLFAGISSPFSAGRYHSLAATQVPTDLIVTAWSGKEVMAVRHRELPVYGVQFHPESVLTPDGSKLARNFLELTR